MSAQTTTEPRATEQNAAYIDALGYAFCATCNPERPTERWRNPDGVCDQCGKDLRLSIERVDGMAVIEYTAAKIF